MHELCINHIIIDIGSSIINFKYRTHNYIVLLENNTLAELVGVTVVTAKETRQQNKKSGA